MSDAASIAIGGRRIGPGCPVYVIAEMSANHHHDLSKAETLVLAAKASGADAIKLQTYTADTLTIDSNETPFQLRSGNTWAGQTLHELYSRAYTPWEWQPRLKALAEANGLHWFSTPFDRTAVDFLAKLDPPAYKIASFELVDLPLIEYVAARRRPVILSTGLATIDEVEEAVRVVRRAGAPLALLRCNSAYPAPPSEMHLRTIPHMAERFGVPVGLSDHTLGSAVALAAVAQGACIIEKHFTLDRSDPGPDSAFSMEPDEFREMVHGIRIVEQALGSVQYEPTPHEQSNRVFRRSLFVVKDVAAGEPFTPENVRSIRPSGGLAPKHLGDVLGRRATVGVKAGTPLSWAHIAASEGASARRGGDVE